jgi:hypothetical protein
MKGHVVRHYLEILKQKGWIEEKREEIVMWEVKLTPRGIEVENVVCQGFLKSGNLDFRKFLIELKKEGYVEN